MSSSAGPPRPIRLHASSQHLVELKSSDHSCVANASTLLFAYTLRDQAEPVSKINRSSVKNQVTPE
jgi:hypothetical protein